MKKVLLAIIVTVCSVAASYAQSGSAAGKWSFGINAGIPVGDASNVSNFALGGDLKYDLPVATSTYFTLSGGYTYFFYKQAIKDAFGESGAGFVPLKAGIKYFFNPGFYGEGQIGAAISTQSNGGTAFAYAPGIGYVFAGGLDLGVRYEGWSKDGTTSQVAFRLGISF